MRLAIIMPVLNEVETLPAALARLAALRASGVELIVADGGSDDGTVAAALPRADLVVPAPRGRASQMNAGAARSGADILLFLHADTQLPPLAQLVVEKAIAGGGRWGRFDVEIAGRSPAFPVIARMMNVRSRLTGIATGDQAIFVRRDLFEQLGGFPDIALMEDIALSKRLKAHAAPVCLREKVTTSGRRWEKHGVLRTVLAMWRLRLAYFLGADPDDLARHYGYAPRRKDGA